MPIVGVIVDVISKKPKRAAQLLHQGTIPYADVAAIVHALAAAADGHAGPNVVRRIAAQLNAWAVPLRDTVEGHVQLATETWLHVSKLPDALEAFGIQMTRDHLETLLQRLLAEQRQGRTRRDFGRGSAAGRAGGAAPSDAIVPFAEPARYEDVDAEDLRRMLVARDASVDDVKQNLRRESGRARYYKTRCSALVSQVRALTTERNEMILSCSMRPGRNVNKYAAYSLAVGRSASHVGAAACLQMMAAGPLVTAF